jgi:CubicO group peptidase (beta-lactamase class C family)
MQLHEAERLSLDQAVTRWLPEFAALRVFQPLEDGHYELARLERPITVRHLLTHTAGFSYGFEPDDPVASFYQAAELLNRSLTISPALPDLIKRLAQIPLAFQPGTAWRYSVAYDVLGRLIELIADRPFESYLREHIFEPLGMVDTGFSVAPDQLDRFGSLYSGPYEHGSQVLDETATSEYRAPGVVPSGGGGLVSTLPDFYRFMSMLLNWGELEGRRLLRQESVAQMITNQVAGHVRQAQGYGFGLSVQSEAQRPPGWPSGLFGHSGGTGTEAFGSREAGLVTIIMYQAANYREPMNRFRELAFAALLPDPPSPANGWP